MKIRSITFFCNPGWPLARSILQRAGEFIAAARPAFEAAGYEVQTCRLATVPFPEIVTTAMVEQGVRLAQQLEELLLPLGIEYISLGPALPTNPWSYEVIPDVIAASKTVFLSGIVADEAGGISLPAIHACAGVIRRLADQSPDGFTNLRFAALANIPPGGPFLPAAYQRTGGAAFALATEAADLAIAAFRSAVSLQEGRQRLVASIEEHARRLESVATGLSQQFGVAFGGLDFTLAPFPLPEHSIGTALEMLGVPSLGLHGSLAAAAIITDTLDQARFTRAGFNGLMLPVLEDAVLAQRAAQGELAVKDLLMYAAVCGTGLDCVPLPGDISVGALAALLLDMAALSQRLRKPLTARLLPVPGKKAGDLTGFDFTYFVNSRVMELAATPLTGWLGGNESFDLSPRRI